jgi:NitT/TauT family transport system substrate-binding protein
MFYTPRRRRPSALLGTEAEDGARAPVLFRSRIAGANTKAVDDVAIRYPDGSVQGTADRVRLVYDVSYMQLAAQGKL